MNRALVVINGLDEGSENTKKMIREAGELASGVDAEVVLLHVTDMEEFQERKASVEAAGMKSMYSIDQESSAAKKTAKKLGREALEGVDVEFEAVGTVGREKREIFDVADEMGCDHIFMVGKKKSPTGKALFGDLTQSVVLNFDGPVTVLTV